MANHPRQNYYANPAFSQQSEFYNGVQLSQVVRQSPIGAQTPLRYLDNPSSYQEGNDETFEGEQEFYEEMLVDDAGIIKEKKVLVVSSQSHEQERYEVRPKNKSRYEYIPMQEHSNRYAICSKTSPKQVQVHRYAVIDTNQEEIGRPPHRYEYIQEEVSPRKNDITQNRYEYIQNESTNPRKQMNHRQFPQNTQGYFGNPVATQKLHELLSTPKQSPNKTVVSPQTRRRPPLPFSPQNNDPFVTPKKTPQKVQYVQKPKAQQKLNYALASRQMVHPDKRHTAIVAPICSSPVQSVYSETTFSHSRSDSWMNLGPKKPTQITLAVAAIMMMLCGGVTSGLCFYMVSVMGRLYFLDFGIVAGFTCLVLGLLGFRTRNCYWLPNRNYISGYIILSVFSLLMCIGLLVLLVLQPKPGTPLADMTSGAVCGISVLSLVLASVGVVTSYCCKYPPPDNRVQHSVPGFRL